MHTQGRRICFWIDGKDKLTRRRICIPLPLLVKLPWPPAPQPPLEIPTDPSPWRIFELQGVATRCVEQLAALATIDHVAELLEPARRDAVQAVTRRVAAEVNERDIGGELDFASTRDH